MSSNNTIRPEFTEEQAEALLTYTETSLGGDDSFDEFRERVSGARDELEKALQEECE